MLLVNFISSESNLCRLDLNDRVCAYAIELLVVREFRLSEFELVYDQVALDGK